MKNRKVTCNELKVISFVGFIIFIILNGIIIKPSLSVLIREMIELSILMAVILYFYCKKYSKKENRPTHL